MALTTTAAGTVRRRPRTTVTAQGITATAGTRNSPRDTPAGPARSIRIEAQDIAFDAERIEVRAGETIRFVVENSGELVHDFTIGTHQTQAAHRDEMTELMARHGGGPEALADPEVMAHHSHPNALILAPGETGELIWTFEEAAEVEFACNVPGHYEAGMRGAS